MKPHSPIEDTGSTAECVEAFSRHVDGGKWPVTAARLRALLRYCQDVNPCNSGVGIGFNPACPLRGEDFFNHFTGREFVLRNRSLSSLGAARLVLDPP